MRPPPLAGPPFQAHDLALRERLDDRRDVGCPRGDAVKLGEIRDPRVPERAERRTPTADHFVTCPTRKGPWCPCLPPARPDLPAGTRAHTTRIACFGLPGAKPYDVRHVG